MRADLIELIDRCESFGAEYGAVDQTYPKVADALLLAAYELRKLAALSSPQEPVAWRVTASKRSSGWIPRPLSRTEIRAMPPSSSSTSTRVAPASRLLSTSSLMTEAGRSTTSPAAIWSMTRAPSTAIRPEAAGAGEFTRDS